MAQGYIQPNERIALVTSTAAFRSARDARTSCNDLTALREIAAVLAHEEWHLRHGRDEESAYDAQLTALLTLGASQDSALYHKVLQAKLAVMAANKRNARATMLARDGG